MTRAVGLCVLAVATLALAGCGDGAGAALHNTVSHGYNRIAVAEKKLQNAAEAAVEKKGARDFDKLSDSLRAYRAAVAEARKDFEEARKKLENVPAQESDALARLQKVYPRYLEQCDASGQAYAELCVPARTPRKDEKDRIRKVFEDEARSKKALGDELRELQKKLAVDFNLKAK